MIYDKDDLLDVLDDSNSVYSEGLGGWLDFWVSGDVLHIHFERDEPREQISGKWKLVPVDD